MVLIGSTSKFRAEYESQACAEMLSGHIVLTYAWPAPGQERMVDVNKRALDDLCLRKIHLADEVIVINPGGYIGTSTAAEIEYAEMCGKPIRWLVSP